jgi:diguanylate cyclase
MNGVGERTPAELAKAALRRLATSRQEPTPENYAQAWADELGESRGEESTALSPRARPVLERMVHRLLEEGPLRNELLQSLVGGRWNQAQNLMEKASEQLSAQAQGWAQLIERITRGLERGGKQWTLARKRDSLQRVLDSSGRDLQRLQHRLRQLVSNWDQEPREAAGKEGEPAQDSGADNEISPPTSVGSAPSGLNLPPAAGPGEADPAEVWRALLSPITATLGVALPPAAEQALELADALAALGQRIQTDGATRAVLAQTLAFCDQARRLFVHRHHVVEQLARLAQELAGGMVELAEDDSWARGQMQALQSCLEGPPSARALKAASEVLARTRERQRTVRAEREVARDALKALIAQMLGELGALDETTGGFSRGLIRFADTIEAADSLASLAEVVREMVAESRSVHALVHSTRERLSEAHRTGMALNERVLALEVELRRLSDEVGTDALTQVANRRGLAQLFEAEQARQQREGTALAVGLLDIDNFKRLNDSLGHAAGDEALVALASHVRRSLRPVDAVARFGGEEFVVLLPATPVDEAQTILTRLQRQLTASLFMHENKEVFVTFSAGVTAYRVGETLEQALERADVALYEAKRTGKNRTCLG